MAEILLRVAPSRVEGQEVSGRLRFGEAVAVCEDGHGWGRKELDDLAWQIVQIPGVPAASLARLLDKYTEEEQELLIAGTWDGTLPEARRRAWRLNVWALSALLANAEATATFLAEPSWSAAFALGLVMRWDDPA